MNQSKTKIGVVGLILVLVAVLASVLWNFPQMRESILASILPNELINLTNQSRADNKLAELIENPLLDRAAQLKANDMAAKSYFAHTSPEGKTPWVWFDKANYDFLYAGENLAVNFTESAAVETAWLNSPTHRANIMDKQFTEIGIATAEGIYKGKKVTFVVQEFGTPMPATKTAYLGRILKEGKNKLDTLTTASTWKANGDSEIYLAVKKIKPLKVDSVAYNRLMDKIIFLLKANTTAI